MADLHEITIKYRMTEGHERFPRWVRRLVLLLIITFVPVLAGLDILTRTAETKSFWRACANRWLTLALAARHCL